MNLTDEQKNTIRQWLDEGLSVADVQSKLDNEFKVSMTYMEVRFLLDDLKATPIDPVEPEPEKPEEPPATAAPDPSPAAPAPKTLPTNADKAAPAGAGKATLTVDKIVRPGAMASGKVTFSDEKTCTWYIDELGRPGLIPPEEGYQPSEADLMAFQQELQGALSGLGL